MTRLLLAAAILLVGASSAQALCVSRPDSATTHYVENNTAQALCLQNELARDAAADAVQARIDADLGNIQIELQRQQQIQQQLLLNTPNF